MMPLQNPPLAILLCLPWLKISSTLSQSSLLKAHPQTISRGRTPTWAHRSAATSSGSGRSGTGREMTSLPPPATKLSAIFALPRHAATHLFQMKQSASYLLGHPNWHQPEPGLCPRCEEEVETTEHALLRCPAPQYARGFFPEALDLKSAWYDATAIRMLAAFVSRTLIAYCTGFMPLEVASTTASPPPLI